LPDDLSDELGARERLARLVGNRHVDHFAEWELRGRGRRELEHQADDVAFALALLAPCLERALGRAGEAAAVPCERHRDARSAVDGAGAGRDRDGDAVGGREALLADEVQGVTRGDVPCELIVLCDRCGGDAAGGQLALARADPRGRGGASDVTLRNRIRTSSRAENVARSTNLINSVCPARRRN
jgi:hypothetical protein